MCRAHKAQDKEIGVNQEQSITERMEVSVFGDDLVEDMDLAMDMDLTNDNALEISGDHSYSECSNSYDDCLDNCTEFPELYDFSESSSAHGSDSDDDSFDYKACQCSISSFH